MTVNDMALAMIRPKPDRHRVADEPAEAVAAAQACVAAPDGIGSIPSARENAQLQRTVALLTAELAQPQIGATAAVNSIVDLLLVQSVVALGRAPTHAQVYVSASPKG
ncbi:hypothetical protein [Streptomyces sp. NBC_00076]|uniref:hypothetical protein n=1 Tax=Streptomyces sp. NBC_00076 TaxID=2975642 RepID=UPI0032464737